MKCMVGKKQQKKYPASEARGAERKHENKRVDSAAGWSPLSVAALKSSFPWDDGTVVLVTLTHATADVFGGI